jgi:hypothetical protein
MASTTNDVVKSLSESFAAAKRTDKPYAHWQLANCLPADTAEEVVGLPFQAPSLDGVSGKRELHNNTRTYFDAANQDRFPVVKKVADALQDRRTTAMVERQFGISLQGSYLRIEYAMDIDGFWLEPHTDLGVKLFTFLLYLPTGAAQTDLGTDIYDTDKIWVGRSRFEYNGALVFVPSNNTFHGFEKRAIAGVRKSVIVNYVTNEWRAREQLAFPNSPIGS